jgi:GxxExxY protein
MNWNLDLHEDDITEKIIGCAIKIHKALGPGLLESAYEECLCYELSKVGLNVERQKALPLVYEEIKLDCGYRVDVLVENKVVVEIKSVDSLTDVHLAQVLTYLKIGDRRLGLLMNFNVSKMSFGIKRVVNKYIDSATSA